MAKNGHECRKVVLEEALVMCCGWTCLDPSPALHGLQPLPLQIHTPDAGNQGEVSERPLILVTIVEKAKRI